MNYSTQTTNDKFIQDRQRIKSVFAHVAQTAHMLKKEILKKNPHAFEHTPGHMNENRRDK